MFIKITRNEIGISQSLLVKSYRKCWESETRHIIAARQVGKRKACPYRKTLFFFFQSLWATLRNKYFPASPDSSVSSLRRLQVLLQKVFIVFYYMQTIY
ncbi:MAG: hypothetical protein K0B11_22615, partial [Mariniphaga sp.]|nr:hypothetical protein [Mariniphaga sp.]